jgi:hypothetical protein
MLSGRRVVRRWLSISLKNIVREGNQHDYDVREDAELKYSLHCFGFTKFVWVYYIGLGLLHWFEFTTLVWVYYIGLGLLHWFGFTIHWFGFTKLVWVLLHWFGFTILVRVYYFGLGLLH